MDLERPSGVGRTLSTAQRVRDVCARGVENRAGHIQAAHMHAHSQREKRRETDKKKEGTDWKVLGQTHSKMEAETDQGQRPPSEGCSFERQGMQSKYP